MRYSAKNNQSNQVDHQLFGVDFHDFIQMEREASPIEIASEFGLSLGEVKRLKEKLHRS